MYLDTDWSGAYRSKWATGGSHGVGGGEVRHSPGAASDSPQPINWRSTDTHIDHLFGIAETTGAACHSPETETETTELAYTCSTCFIVVVKLNILKMHWHLLLIISKYNSVIMKWRKNSILIYTEVNFTKLKIVCVIKILFTSLCLYRLLIKKNLNFFF